MFVQKRTRVSPWRVRIGLTAAALASLATSPPEGWHLDAQLPAEISPPPGMAYRYAVESSSRPHIWFDRSTVVRAKHDDENPADPKRVEFLLLSGERLKWIRVTGYCDENGCQDGVCDPPGDAYARLLEPTQLPTWSRRVDRDVTISAVSESGSSGVRFQVKLDVADSVPVEALAPGGPGTLRFEVVPEDQETREIDRQVSAYADGTGAYVLHVTSLGSDSVSFGDRWHIAAILEGLCEEEACPAPDAKLEIQSIVGYRAPSAK